MAQHTSVRRCSLLQMTLRALFMPPKKCWLYVSTSFFAHDRSLPRLGDDISNASPRRCLSGQPVAPVNNEDVASDAVALRASDNALVSGALKNGNRYGDQDLQAYLLQLLINMMSKHHPTLLNDVIPGTFNCGRRALMIIETFIMPKNAHVGSADSCLRRL